MGDWLRFLCGVVAAAGPRYVRGRGLSPGGRFWSEARAQRAARRHLEELERTQPSATSGGQTPGGIQDRVYIVRPSGTAYRYWPQDRPPD